MEVESSVISEVLFLSKHWCKEAMTEKSWNVTGYAGKNAQLRLVDHFSGHLGHINFDHLQACHKLISDTNP